MTVRLRPLQILRGLALALGLSAGGASVAAETCDPARLEIRGEGARASFRVAVADTAEARARGLMFVENMPAMSGMLFAYEGEQPVSFWMKNTLIPLDMIFFDRAGVVVHVHPNAKPHDLTPVPSVYPAQFVLELNGGMATKLRIAPGAQMRHPSVPQDLAAWPCE